MKELKQKEANNMLAQNHTMKQIGVLAETKLKALINTLIGRKYS